MPNRDEDGEFIDESARNRAVMVAEDLDDFLVRCEDENFPIDYFEAVNTMDA